VSPDGELSYVPFALLLGRREVAYVPSGTTHLLLQREAARRGEGVLALGDPAYPGAGPVGDEGRGGLPLRLGRLAKSRAEAQGVGDRVLLGADATEAGLRRALGERPRWRAVHLACHGLLDVERPMRSCLALTPSDEDDGFLTALEVLRMRVPADLAVLSACETGRGRVVRGEGIMGLTRAFMFAGTPRVLVSLWDVDDEATQALMARLYVSWKKGTPLVRALADAQDHVRAQPKWSHPQFWAAWVLWGLAQ
jgi:CHAT domain-containing protein